MKCFAKRHVTIVSGDEPSTSTRRSIPGYAIPEELLASVVGSWDRWRALVVAVFCVVMIFSGLNVFSSELFIPLHLSFNCTEGSTRTHDSCFTLNGSRCRTFKFSSRYGYTLTEKWHLVCSKRITVDVSNILFRFGMALGYVVMGYLADRWGRKKVLFICLVLQPCGGILTSATKDYTSFSISRFFSGFSLSGTSLMAIVLTCEISSNKWRTFDLGLLCLSFAVGHALLRYVWMIFADSMKNILVMSIPQIILIGFMGLIRESPNWLLCKNQTTTAESVLLIVARFNGQKMPSTFRLRPVQIINVSDSRSLRFFSILKPSKVRWVVVGVCLIWFLTTFINGLVMELLLKKNEDLLEITFLSGASSTAAAIMSLILCHIVKHKITIALSSILGGITISVVYFVGEHIENYDDKMLLAHLVAYGFHTLALFTLCNLTPRVFPTEMRGECTGVAIAVGELSFTFARLILPFLHYKLRTFLATLWSCIAAILLCANMLVSVHKRELPDIIEDAVNFRDTCKPTRWSTLRASSPTTDETEVKIVDFERGTSLTLAQPNYLVSKSRKMKAINKDIATTVNEK